MPVWGYFAIVFGAVGIHVWVLTLEQKGPIIWLLDKLGLHRRLPHD